MRKSILLSTSMLMAASAFVPAVAQDEDDVIIVTAAKREQTLQEVPIAVSVVDADVIEKAQINDIFDLQSVVPSLRVSQLERSANSTFVIRGFGNGGNNIGIEPSVAVYIDGVFRTRSAGFLGDFPDVERVEVLRGPQSTLFGKNASAGVVSFVTKAPSFEKTGSIEATLGNENQTILKGYYSAPISDDVAFSVAGAMNQRDGYVENLGTGDDLNDRNRWMLRGQLLFTPSDNASVRLIADYDTLDEVCCYAPNYINGPTGGAIVALGGQVPDDPYAYETYLNFAPTNEVTNYGFSGQVDVDLGWSEFVSITSYRGQQSESNGDVDFTSAPLIGNNLNRWDIDTFTQEFRLSGSSDRVDWMTGAYYYNESLTKNSDVLYGPLFNAYAGVLSGLVPELEAALNVGTFFEEGTGTTEYFDHDNESYNLFGQVDFALTDRLTATAAVGYVNDTKEVAASAINNDLYASLDLPTVLNDPAVMSQLSLEGVIGASFDDAVLAGAYEAVTMTAFDVADYVALATAAAGGDATAIATLGAIDSVTPAVAAGTAAAIAPGLADALGALQFLPGFATLPNAVEDNETNDDKVTYTLRLAYDLSDAVNVYGSYATGFKASSWNLTRDSSYLLADQAALATAGLIPTNRADGTRFSGPEDVEVFELGLKARFPNGAINVAVFDQTIEGFQSTLFQGTGFVLANAGEQSAKGLEIETTYNPIEDLTLVFNGLFLDPEYVEYLNAPGPDGTTIDLSGTTPAGIHEMSLYFGAQYDIDFGNGITGFIRGDYQHEDSVRVVDNLDAAFPERTVNLLNASMGIELENGLEMTLWGRNLTDDEYSQSGFPTTAQGGSTNGYPNMPFSYGVTARKSW